MSGEDTDFMASFTKLKTLMLGGMPNVNLNFLSNLGQLEILVLNFEDEPDLRPLSQAPSLKDLTLCSTAIKDVSAISSLENLVRLDLFCPSVRDLRPLSGLKNLEELWVQGITADDSSVLGGLSGLKKLNIWGEENLDFLSRLNNLEHLTIELVGQNPSFDSQNLSQMLVLEFLSLSYSGKRPEMIVLSTLPNLKVVWMNGRMITDMSEFAGD